MLESTLLPSFSKCQPLLPCSVYGITVTSWLYGGLFLISMRFICLILVQETCHRFPNIFENIFRKHHVWHDISSIIKQRELNKKGAPI